MARVTATILPPVEKRYKGAGLPAGALIGLATAIVAGGLLVPIAILSRSFRSSADDGRCLYARKLHQVFH
jgi:hypothetical protein